MIKVLIYSVYIQLLIFFRIKVALFFSLVFPLMLYIIFGSLWGNNGESNYYYFLITGIICMNAMTEGLFVIGPIIKEYYANGILKFFKKINTETEVFILFLTIVIARLIVLFFGLFILNIVSTIVFNFQISVSQIITIIPAITLAFIVFSFFGLCLAFMSLNTKNNSGTNYTNIIYYIILFTSNTFYPVDKLNKTVNLVGNLFPLNNLLSYSRNENYSSLNILLWLSISVLCFLLLLKKITFKR